MRVLVTGGTGFTGAALVERLCRDGHDVVALDVHEGIRRDELQDVGADVVLGSVTDEELVERCVEGADAVMHVAAAFRELNVSEEHYDRVNVEGTRIVLDAAIAAGVTRFVYCSTCGVHGHVEDPPADEDAPIAPADYYQRSKYEGEPLVRRAHERGDVRAVVLRPAAIYGPGDPGRFLMLFRWADRGWFPMFGDGSTYYHPVYIDNLVDAFVACLDEERLTGRPYLIADDRYLTIEELVRAVGRAIGRDVRVLHLPITPLVAAGHVVERACRPLGIEPPIFPRRVDWYRQDRAFDISRARRELDYEPRVSLEEGLRRTGEWYRTNGYL
ncbi:MAG: NAD-dependent epimerase/dehydratase family protein [Gemmatimonadota bacterium]|nr:NAD-dependent epimerase/dehydratase family protein [Gemmatimonadota bacterium]